MYLKWDKSKEGKQTGPCVEYKMVPLPLRVLLKCKHCLDSEDLGARSFPMLNTSSINKTFFCPICVLALAALVEVEEKLSKNSLVV